MSIRKITSVVLTVFACAIAAHSESSVKPEAAFTNNVDRAIGSLIAQRHMDLIKPRSVRFFLISPTAYSEAEFAEARRVGTDAEPFWIGGRPHKVFRELALDKKDASRFGRCIYADLTYGDSHDEYKLLSFCLFQPMHAFEITFDDGARFDGAICVHCGDLMFRLPRPNMEEYRGVQSPELIAEVGRILPIPKDLEARFFPRHDH